KANTLGPALASLLEQLNPQSLDNLPEIGARCRELVIKGLLPQGVKEALRAAYQNLVQQHGAHLSLAVRSSAIGEDSPTASFAGQHDSFLNIKSCEALEKAIVSCYASLFNDRAIKYRIDNKFPHLQTGLSIGVQLMVRSDKSSAGVAFTIEPENGNTNLIYITGAWGLGESVVQGAVNTDEFYLSKQALDKNKNPIVYR